MPILLCHGATPFVTDTYTRTPLHLAALHDNLVAGKILIESITSMATKLRYVSVQDFQGETVYDYVVKRWASSLLNGVQSSYLPEPVGRSPMSRILCAIEINRNTRRIWLGMVANTKPNFTLHTVCGRGNERDENPASSGIWI